MGWNHENELFFRSLAFFFFLPRTNPLGFQLRSTPLNKLDVTENGTKSPLRFERFLFKRVLPCFFLSLLPRFEEAIWWFPRSSWGGFIRKSFAIWGGWGLVFGRKSVVNKRERCEQVHPSDLLRETAKNYKISYTFLGHKQGKVENEGKTRDNLVLAYGKLWFFQ